MIVNFNLSDIPLKERIKGIIKLQRCSEVGNLEFDPHDPEFGIITVFPKRMWKMICTHVKDEDLRFKVFTYVFAETIEEEIVHYEIMPECNPRLLHNIGYGDVKI